ncbi:hypothetical protein [Adhaeribacter aquaticus]|uniref:hypothetical protein n=1 Tax=Adhaeribacter aquaticus TaxID=299567 RepID=UPI0004299F54|nr:hypothetical protein [Adhaeribacter aquaticus]
MFTFFRKANALLAIALFSQSCEVDPVNPELPKEERIAKIYLIPKNEHSSNNTIQLLGNNRIKFKTKFDNSAIYLSKDPVNQYDINKLYGFSDCRTAHHTNSARFGWRWLNKRLEVLAYTYKDGVRYEQFISAVDLNTEYVYELECLENKYIFRLNGETVEMERGCNDNPQKYKLFPYFGGDEVAPHDITITITDIES